MSVGKPLKQVLCDYEIETKMLFSPFKLDLHQVKVFLPFKILGQSGLSIRQDISLSITGIHHSCCFFIQKHQKSVQVFTIRLPKP